MAADVGTGLSRKYLGKIDTSSLIISQFIYIHRNSWLYKKSFASGFEIQYPIKSSFFLFIIQSGLSGVYKGFNVALFGAIAFRAMYMGNWCFEWI